VSAIHTRLEQIAREVFDDDELVLTEWTTAGDVPGWDSLGHVNFMYCVEEEFGVRFSATEFAGYRNVGELKRTLEAKAAA
jgi:acyl carrier protein